jgi:glucose-1-phosphate adenylyltransferase
MARSSWSDVVALILAGGEGKRLYPLTRDRAKPAVPFGGRYRHHRLRPLELRELRHLQISVLTQYKAGSRYAASGARLAARAQLGHYVAPVPASMNVGPQWFRGSADAVYPEPRRPRERKTL